MSPPLPSSSSTARNSLTARVRELLHRQLPVLSEREAAERLRPHVDKLTIAPATPPPTRPGWLDALCSTPSLAEPPQNLTPNDARPQDFRPEGERDEQVFEDAKSTG